MRVVSHWRQRGSSRAAAAAPSGAVEVGPDRHGDLLAVALDGQEGGAGGGGGRAGGPPSAGPRRRLCRRVRGRRPPSPRCGRPLRDPEAGRGRRAAPPRPPPGVRPTTPSAAPRRRFARRSAPGAAAGLNMNNRQPSVMPSYWASCSAPAPKPPLTSRTTQVSSPRGSTVHSNVSPSTPSPPSKTTRRGGSQTATRPGICISGSGPNDATPTPPARSSTVCAARTTTRSPARSPRPATPLRAAPAPRSPVLSTADHRTWDRCASTPSLPGSGVGSGGGRFAHAANPTGGRTGRGRRRGVPLSVTGRGRRWGRR